MREATNLSAIRLMWFAVVAVGCSATSTGSHAFDDLVKDAPLEPATIQPHLGALARDCSAGSELACMALTEVYTSVLGTARRSRDAVTPIFEKACHAGDQMACAVWGDTLDDDSGTSLDTPRAIRLLATACDHGIAIACARAAMIRLDSGLELPELTEQRATALLEPACAARQAYACWQQYQMLGARDQSPFEDATTYYDALVRVCALGDRHGCLTLVRELVPVRPFGCDQCAKGDDQGDDRCRDCEIAACRLAQCCPTCAGREHEACCADMDMGVADHPLHAPPLDASRVSRAVDAARRGTSHARALWQTACARGFRPACEAERDVDRALAELAATPLAT